MAPRFFKCELCGQVAAVSGKKGGDLVCCGKNMTELIPNTTDAAQEKHVPVIGIDGNIVTVKVGSAEHPMTEAHLIEWILLSTKQGAQRKFLKAGDAPKAVFALADGDEVLEAYAYCNLHGLWKASV